MGKRLEDLSLDDIPLAPELPAEAAALLEIIHKLLATGDYAWAEETLDGIRQTIERTGRATLRQREAVEHIIVGRLRHDLGR